MVKYPPAEEERSHSMPRLTADFLEFPSHGLNTFENAMDRDERLMTVPGSRLLESNKKVAESAHAIELRQCGEHSIDPDEARKLADEKRQHFKWLEA